MKTWSPPRVLKTWKADHGSRLVRPQRHARVGLRDLMFLNIPAKQLATGPHHQQGTSRSKVHILSCHVTQPAPSPITRGTHTASHMDVNIGVLLSELKAGEHAVCPLPPWAQPTPVKNIWGKKGSVCAEGTRSFPPCCLNSAV